MLNILFIIVQVKLHTMTQNPTVKFLIDDNGVALVTLSRLQVANALNSDMALEIKEIFYNLPPQVRAVILTGEGDRAFCAGADLKERHGMDMEASCYCGGEWCCVWRWA